MQTDFKAQLGGIEALLLQVLARSVSGAGGDAPAPAAATALSAQELALFGAQTEFLKRQQSKADTAANGGTDDDSSDSTSTSDEEEGTPAAAPATEKGLSNSGAATANPTGSLTASEVGIPQSATTATPSVPAASAAVEPPSPQPPPSAALGTGLTGLTALGEGRNEDDDDTSVLRVWGGTGNASDDSKPIGLPTMQTSPLSTARRASAMQPQRRASQAQPQLSRGGSSGRRQSVSMARRPTLRDILQNDHSDKNDPASLNPTKAVRRESIAMASSLTNFLTAPGETTADAAFDPNASLKSPKMSGSRSSVGKLLNKRTASQPLDAEEGPSAEPAEAALQARKSDEKDAPRRSSFTKFFRKKRVKTTSNGDASKDKTSPKPSPSNEPSKDSRKMSVKKEASLKGRSASLQLSGAPAGLFGSVAVQPVLDPHKGDSQGTSAKDRWRSAMSKLKTDGQLNDAAGGGRRGSALRRASKTGDTQAGSSVALQLDQPTRRRRRSSASDQDLHQSSAVVPLGHDRKMPTISSEAAAQSGPPTDEAAPEMMKLRMSITSGGARKMSGGGSPSIRRSSIHMRVGAEMAQVEVSELSELLAAQRDDFSIVSRPEFP